MLWDIFLGVFCGCGSSLLRNEIIVMSLGHGNLLDSLLALSARTFGLGEMQKRFLDKLILCVTYCSSRGLKVLHQP